MAGPRTEGRGKVTMEDGGGGWWEEKGKMLSQIYPAEQTLHVYSSLMGPGETLCK